MTNLRSISVIIPAHQAEKTIAETIASVLGQSLLPFEVIVVDDGSTDRVEEVVRSIDGVLYLRQEHAGAGAARNRGAEAASGELLAFVDADDLWEPDKLALQMAAWDRDPTADMVFGHMVEFVSPELSAEEAAGLAPRPGVLSGLSPITLLMKRERFLATGGFQTHWQLGEFIEWYARVQREGLRSLLLPDVVARRRLHAGNHGHANRGQASEYAKIVKQALDLRRAQAAAKKPA
jgi:glycosyltransferase involved in cell wall biosynthesis